MRRWTAWTSGWVKHAAKLHQHCVEVRTGLTWSPASERAKCSLHTPSKASPSSSEMKSLRTTTHGSVESARGAYWGKSESTRSKSGPSRPARTAGVWLSRVHRAACSRGITRAGTPGHRPHARLHC